jgi:hypothetical protein
VEQLQDVPFEGDISALKIDNSAIFPLKKVVKVAVGTATLAPTRNRIVSIVPVASIYSS